MKNNQRGITLIALVITIIVLLILAGVTIATLTGENGILTIASDAKIETAVAAVKEVLRLEQIEKKIDDEEVNPETLLANGKVQRTVQQREDGNYHIYYALKEKAYEGMQGLGKGNLASLEDVFLIDDDLNVKYISSNGKEYGDELEAKILEDETEIRFASEAFSKFVSLKAGVTEDEMKFKWMKEQTSLTITDTSVDSLQDLVFFPNLTSLQLGTNANNAPQITSMDGVENCTKLKELKIYYGPDKNYSTVAQLKNLTSFTRFNGKDFENIINALKYCSNLETLELSGVKIISMQQISSFKNLKSLTLNDAEITMIQGLERLTKLTNLSLVKNNITKIEGLENLINLKSIYLGRNNISDITPLSKNSSLTSISLYGNPNIDENRNNYTGERLEALNKLEKILDNGGTILLDIDKIKLFTNYKKLSIAGQNISTLENIEGLTELESLSAERNNITLEDEKSQEIIKSMTKLETLSLSNNKITNITALNSLNNLKALYLKGNENIVNLVQIQDILPNLDVLSVSNESLKTIIKCDITKILHLNVYFSELTQIPDLSKFVNLTSLNISSNNIENIGIVSKITSLKELNISNTNLKGRMIDFSKLTNLTNLNLSVNTLWSEDLQNLKALKNNTGLTINLSNNSIIDATALLELNPNTKINLSGNVNLSPDSKKALTERFGSNVTF